jgi:transposase
LGTNNIIFNSFGMAILQFRGILLSSLDNKYLSEISSLVDFDVPIANISYNKREICYSNVITVKDDLITRFNYVKDIKNNKLLRLKSHDNIKNCKDNCNITNNDNDNIKGNYSSSTDKVNPIEPLILDNNIDNNINQQQQHEHNSYNYFTKYNLVDFIENKKVEIKLISDNISIKTYGSQILLEHISNSTGLTDIIKHIFPSNWKDILTLSFYICTQDKPLMYCENWLENMDGLIPSSRLTSQRISDILSDIKVSDRYNFYKSWANFRQEQEYIAFDITSISSYSEKILDVAKGYNRDGDKLRQINLCLLFGEDSGLPIYSTSYSGSVTDVKAFSTVIDQIDFLNPDKGYKFVFDKGFYSNKNINKMLYNLKINNQNMKFVISIPLKYKFIKNLIDQHSVSFNDNNQFIAGKDLLYGTTINYQWDSEHNLYLHIFYNEKNHLSAKQDKMADIIMLKEEAQKFPEKYKNTYDHKKFLNYIPKDNDSKEYNITLKLENVLNLYKNEGWFFIISNDVNDYRSAIDIYRHKDMVEKAFYRLKNNLDLKRLRTHTDITTENKLFISFISLILFSVIHKCMDKADLYKLYTVQGLIEKLDNLRFIYADPNILVKPLTKSENDIFKAFNINIE